jgi:hypothetical protein
MKELFPILNRLNSPHAIRDIRESGEDETTLVGPNGVQFHFNAKLGAILPQAVKVLADKRSIGDRLQDGPYGVSGVSFMKALGDQEVDGLSDELFAPVTKNLFRFGVYKEDLALNIHHDHGDRGSLHNESKAVIREYAIRNIEKKPSYVRRFPVRIS